MTSSFGKTVISLMLCALFASFAACGGGGTGKHPSGNDSDLPGYVDPDDAVYKFGKEEWTTPYWAGNVMYNETVMLVDRGNGIAEGKLQYNPVKVLSVRDYTFKNEYKEDEDYIVSGNSIMRTANSEIPYLTAENLRGNNIPAPYRNVYPPENIITDYTMMGKALFTEGTLIYGHQVAVSYVFNPAEVDLTIMPAYDENVLPRLHSRLETGKPVKMDIIGDSVAEGCSSSSFFSRPPYMPNFFDMATDRLAEIYDSPVEARNRALGGMTSDWGCAPEQIQRVAADEPDVVYIHFGINDLGSGYLPERYIENIKSLIMGVKERVPDCEFVVMECFTPNPDSYSQANMAMYWQQVSKLVAETEDVYALDLFTLSTEMLRYKQYIDVTGNGVNHVNDFTSRLYAMSILAQLVQY